MIVSDIPANDEATTAVLFLAGRGNLTRDFNVSYDQAGDFSDELSMTTPIARADAPSIAQVRLRDSPKWDPSKTILRLKMLIESNSGVVAEASPGAAPTSSDQFTINYLVFDRAAFSDTFERPK